MVYVQACSNYIKFFSFNFKTCAMQCPFIFKNFFEFRLDLPLEFRLNLQLGLYWCLYLIINKTKDFCNAFKKST